MAACASGDLCVCERSISTSKYYKGTSASGSLLIYVNGINTSCYEASETALQLHKDLKCDVAFFYNKCFDTQAMLGLAKGIFLDLLTNRPLEALASMKRKYAEIQECKTTSAQELAVQVQAIGKMGLWSKIVLLGHSQGAHVADQAYQALELDMKTSGISFKMITIGGLVSTSNAQSNYLFSDDHFARIAQEHYGKSGKLTTLGPTETGSGHAVESYIKNKDVKQGIALALTF